MFIVCFMEALERAIALFDTKAELARRLGYTSSMTIKQWQNRGRVPAEAGFEIERLTNGKVTARELCPYLFGDAA